MDKQEVYKKVMAVLTDQLSSEEFSMVEDVKIGLSIKDREAREAMKESYLEASAMFIAEEKRLVEEDMSRLIVELAKHLGVKGYTDNEFVRSVAQWFEKTGRVSDKQVQSLTKHIEVQDD